MTTTDPLLPSGTRRFPPEELAALSLLSALLDLLVVVASGLMAFGQASVAARPRPRLVALGGVILAGLQGLAFLALLCGPAAGLAH